MPVSAHNIPVFADCAYDGSQPYNSDVPPNVPNIISGPGVNDIREFCITRHDGRTPVVMSFLDSSVRSVGLREQWTLGLEHHLQHHARASRLGSRRHGISAVDECVSIIISENS